MKSTELSGRKFQGLSPRQQHKILARIAAEFLTLDRPAVFWSRYAALHGLTALDRYRPPSWLTEVEAIEECRAFHRRQAGLPDDQEFNQPAADDPQSPVEAETAQEGRLSWQPKFQVEIAVDQVRSPYNLGSILRLIDNFGLKGLVHASADLRLDHPQLRRAARGCQDWIPVRYEPELPAYLAGAKVPVLAVEVEDGAVSIEEWQPPPACILVLGHEAYGISRQLRRCCEAAVYVPMHGFKRSMNLSHALAVIAQKIVEGAG